MRAHQALAISALALILGGSAAGAADLPVAPVAQPHGYFRVEGRHASQYFIYDDQPGVYVRAYWREPWHHRHYFPRTGEPPEIGRDEDLTKRGPAPEPAESFERSWSTAWDVPTGSAAGALPSASLK